LLFIYGEATFLFRKDLIFYSFTVNILTTYVFKEYNVSDNPDIEQTGKKVPSLTLCLMFLLVRCLLIPYFWVIRVQPLLRNLILKHEGRIAKIKAHLQTKEEILFK
jgi:hypothetical protein